MSLTIHEVWKNRDSSVVVDLQFFNYGTDTIKLQNILYLVSKGHNSKTGNPEL